MAESFSRRLALLGMAEMENEITVLDIIRDIFDTERIFYGTVRFLDGQTRNHIVAAQLRNTNLALQIVREYMSRPIPQTQSLVMNIDLSGNILRSFLDPVPVIATPAQISAATERDVAFNTSEICSICRDSLSRGTRLRGCGHCFHTDCINEWLGLNTRCPVCRHDIRESSVYAPRANPPQ